MSKTTLIAASISALAALAALALACSKKIECNPTVSEISGNHGHTLVTKEQAAEGSSPRYALTGGSHEHVVRVDESNAKRLGAGEAVELRSSSVNAHLHVINFSCK